MFLEIARGLLSRSFEVDVVLVKKEGSFLRSVPAEARVVNLGARRTVLAGPALRRYLARERPAVVISTLNPTNVANVVISRLVRPRVPAVLVQMNTVSMALANATPKARIPLVLARWLFPQATRVVAVSNGVADDMAAALHLDLSNVNVIYSPVIGPELEEAGRAPITHPWLVDRAGPVLVAVGRLTSQKDFPTLLRTLALLPDDHRLLLLGDGEERGALTDLAADLGVADRVDMPGFVDNPYPFLAAADLLVQSSRWEGLPTVLIEALPFACGIVATDCPSGPREILDGGRWGRLVPPGDAGALADAITAELRQRRVRSREAWRRYETDHAVDQYVRLIEDVTRAG